MKWLCSWSDFSNFERKNHRRRRRSLPWRRILLKLVAVELARDHSCLNLQFLSLVFKEVFTKYAQRLELDFSEDWRIGEFNLHFRQTRIKKDFWHFGLIYGWTTWTVILRKHYRFRQRQIILVHDFLFHRDNFGNIVFLRRLFLHTDLHTFFSVIMRNRFLWFRIQLFERLDVLDRFYFVIWTKCNLW